jgi:hypothetical protein
LFHCGHYWSPSWRTKANCHWGLTEATACSHFIRTLSVISLSRFPYQNRENCLATCRATPMSFTARYCGNSSAFSRRISCVKEFVRFSAVIVRPTAPHRAWTSPSISLFTKTCSSNCTSLAPVTCESASRLQRIHELPFERRDPLPIAVPRSIEVVFKSYFHEWPSLASITFELMRCAI